ncbi:unnamed protein product [Thelazia callipaeda]|uniref:Secreted protein n=1 Tax=Thelazia callipaeda TaxID=103827 RepID=A0A0N5D732_THECL|nr:unnamed protein product [Thelazia callipaeda]
MFALASATLHMSLRPRWFIGFVLFIPPVEHAAHLQKLPYIGTQLGSSIPVLMSGIHVMAVQVPGTKGKRFFCGSHWTLGCSVMVYPEMHPEHGCPFSMAPFEVGASADFGVKFPLPKSS